MTRISQQAIALIQTRVGGLIVDGIDGEKTREKVKGDPFKVFSEITGGMSLDCNGDPDWAEWLGSFDTVADKTIGEDGVSGSFIPKGVMIHHTAGPKGRERINEDVLRNGRPGIRGPLVQIGISRDGSASFITNGRAQHAGHGWGGALTFPPEPRKPFPLIDDTYGNSHFIGIEIDNSGQPDDVYPLKQMQRAARIASSICRVWGWGANSVLGHKEWTRRKVDPSFDMVVFRESVKEHLHASPALTMPQIVAEMTLERRVSDLEKAIARLAEHLP